MTCHLRDDPGTTIEDTPARSAARSNPAARWQRQAGHAPAAAHPRGVAEIHPCAAVPVPESDLCDFRGRTAAQPVDPAAPTYHQVGGGGIVAEPREAVARLPFQRGEIAPHEDFSIRLHRKGIDIAVRLRVEAGVQTAVRVEPNNGVDRLTHRSAEIAPHEDFSVRLQREGIDIAVRSRVEIVRDLGMESAGRQDADDQQEQAVELA